MEHRDTGVGHNVHKNIWGIMTTMETIEERLEHYVKVNELQHQGIMDKLDTIHNDVVKDLSFHTKKIEKIENEVEQNKTVRVWILAIATFIAICIPIMVGIVF